VSRRIFIGDIQGCRDELERLLEELRFDPAADELHPVGDLVNRGPDSVGCLRLLSAVKAGGVLGNHDLHLLHAAAGTRELRDGDTIGDVLAAGDRDELLAWLAARPFVRAFDDVVLVHAGFSPAWDDPVGRLRGSESMGSMRSLDPLEPGADARFAVKVRMCDADGRMGRRDDDTLQPWHELFDRARIGGRTVVFGHWASQGLLVRDGFRGLDSGCVWGKQLSAWIAEEDRVVQVQAARAYAQIK
jgi:bis(5'-nucleosyl)-tetraphosphatase (symmetrical)